MRPFSVELIRPGELLHVHQGILYAALAVGGAPAAAARSPAPRARGAFQRTGNLDGKHFQLPLNVGSVCTVKLPPTRREYLPKKKTLAESQQRHVASANRTKLPSCLKSAVLRNESLRLLFREAVRHFSCSWPSHGITAVNLHVLPLTAEPEVDFPLVPSATAGQADFLLDAWGARARDAGLRCTSTSDDLPDAPHLVMAQYWGWHADLGYARAQRFSPVASIRVRQRVCAHYVTMRELMYPSQPTPHASVGMLLYASEPANPATLSAAERLIEQRAAIDASHVIMVHLNLGSMLGDAAALRLPRWSHVKHWAHGRAELPSSPPVKRLRQGYWHSLLWQMSAGRRHKSRLCASSHSNVPQARASSRQGQLPRLPGARFLMFGGAPKLFRGFAMLEMRRRGLLQQGRWSAARFTFCEHRSPVTAYDSPPFGLQDQERLLNDAALVDSFCALLPKILDVMPSLKTEILATGDERIWQGTRCEAPRAHDVLACLCLSAQSHVLRSFSVTFESLMPDEPTPQTLFLTEKTTKPMAHLHPFVLLGPAGSLAALRALGFRTFSPTVDERYDRLLDGRMRLDAVLAEVERMARFNASDWQQPKLLAAVGHNWRHLFCGGLLNVMLAQADELFAMATRLGGWLERSETAAIVLKPD